MPNFVRADRLPLPDTRTLGERVHGFMDANPQLGQDPAGNLPGRKANQLFQQLMSKYYGQPNETIDKMGMDPMLDQFLAAVPNADAYADANPGTSMAEGMIDAMYEPQINQDAIAITNSDYDSQQPYGFDFSSYGTPDFYGQYSKPGAMEAVSGDGEIIPAPENPQLPSIIRTAGSYALPMLFSMLMRGGK